MLFCNVLQTHLGKRVTVPRLNPTTVQMIDERSFTCADPLTWSTLVTTLHTLSTTDSFKHRLKAVLFTRTYGL